MAYETIDVETRGRVGVVTLNRPEALNAINEDLVAELAEALDEFEADDEIGCIVITGGEKNFAAGADIKEMVSKSFVEAYQGDFIGPWDRLARCRKPTIAAVCGYALGGGCELALMCDIILAAENAKFGQPEIGLGIIPGAGATQRLTRAVGKAKAMEMILSGRRMDASEAEECGLVTRVVPSAALMEETMEVADRIAANPRTAVMLAKEAVNAAAEMPLSQGVLFERRLFYALFATDDQKEGMTAFAEKRKPAFRNS